MIISLQKDNLLNCNLSVRILWTIEVVPMKIEMC